MPAEHTHREDPRIKKTELRLRRALFENLTTTSFAQLSVARITATAGVTRGTFYQHYADKDDFIAAVRRDTIADWLNASVFSRDNDGEQVPRMHVGLALEYLRRPDNGFKVLLQDDGEAFTIEFARGINAALTAYADAAHLQAQGEFRLSDLIAAASMTNVAIFKEWTLHPHHWTGEYVAILIPALTQFAPETGIHLNQFYC